MSSYLVTGGAGFVGSHLVEALLARGDAVRVLDDFSTGKPSNLAAFEGRVDVREGCVRDTAAVGQAMAGIDAVFHLAAMASVADSLERPVECHDRNSTGTLVVLEAASQAGCRMVYVGSSSAYGRVCDGPISEDQREDPLSIYATSKLAGEYYCRNYNIVHELNVAIVRFFNIYGPRQAADSPYSGVVAAFCDALEGHRVATIHGDGSQVRDFTFVTDAVQGLILAMDKLGDQALPGCPTINLATGHCHTVLELFEHLRAVAGSSIEPTYGPARAGDVKLSMADIRRAEKLLGFRAEVPFNEGLRITYDWYRSLNS